MRERDPVALELRPITLGASSLGDPSRDVDAAALADALLTSDFGQVDTSNNYAKGNSETELGKAVRRAGGLPDGTVIFSKVDSEPDTGVFDGDRVKRSFEETTTRLGIDYLPVLHLHDPYTIDFAEAMAPGGAVEALTSLRDQGLVGAIGIAAGPVDLMLEYVRSDAFDAVLSHNHYTLVDRAGSAIFEAAHERGMTIFNAAPFGGGMLAGSERAAGQYAYKDAPAELLAFVDRLRGLADEWGIPLAAAALHYSLRNPVVHSTVVGISSLERLDELGRLASTEVPDGFFAAVDDLGAPPHSGND
jgi:D-threo-aldose 1-dehydrogenase